MPSRRRTPNRPRPAPAAERGDHDMLFTTSWARASIRKRWLSLLGIAALLGLMGGLALTTLAGARRTQSAYPRFLRSRHPSTLVVDIGSLADGGYPAMTEISRLPQVVRARAYTAFLIAPVVN